MLDYFGYINDASYDDIDDTDDVVDEFALSLLEFDTYVQEASVGVKILIGVGIAAALAGLIALIVFIVKKKGNKGAVQQSKKTEADAKALLDSTDKKAADEAVKKSKETKKGLAVLGDWFRGLFTKKADKKADKIGESYFYDSNEYDSYYQEALNPTRDNIKNWKALLKVSIEYDSKYIDVITEMVNTACEVLSATTSNNNENIEAAKRAIRPSYVKYDRLTNEFVKTVSKYSFDTSDPTAGVIESLTVEDIIDLCELVESTYKGMDADIVNLRRMQNKIRDYKSKYRAMEATGASEWLDNSVGKLINKITSEASQHAVTITTALKNFDVALIKIRKDLEGGKYYSSTINAGRELAFDDLSDTINRRK